MESELQVDTLFTKNPGLVGYIFHSSQEYMETGVYVSYLSSNL